MMKQDSGTGELFAQVNYAKPFTQVEPVLDSSRYFVLRVEGEAGKVAYIGMGFQERGDAFDFQVSSAYKRALFIPRLAIFIPRLAIFAGRCGRSQLMDRSHCRLFPNAAPTLNPARPRHRNLPNLSLHPKTIR